MGYTERAEASRRAAEAAAQEVGARRRVADRCLAAVEQHGSGGGREDEYESAERTVEIERD